MKSQVNFFASVLIKLLLKSSFHFSLRNELKPMWDTKAHDGEITSMIFFNSYLITSGADKVSIIHSV